MFPENSRYLEEKRIERGWTLNEITVRKFLIIEMMVMLFFFSMFDCIIRGPLTIISKQLSENRGQERAEIQMLLEKIDSQRAQVDFIKEVIHYGR